MQIASKCNFEVMSRHLFKATSGVRDYKWIVCLMHIMLSRNQYKPPRENSNSILRSISSAEVDITMLTSTKDNYFVLSCCVML